MDHEDVKGPVTRSPLRTFRVERVDPENAGWRGQTTVVAHLVFNNKQRGEGLVFRRYYDDSVRTEIVAEFEQGHFSAYYEINGE